MSEDRGARRPRGRKPRRKVCAFCVDKIEYIDYKTEGYYVYVAFNGASELPKELSRNLGISESVIRSQIVKLLEKKSSVKPRAARVAPVSEETETAASEQA